jgi:KipI family sensor histidine kinase inhibitor
VRLERITNHFARLFDLPVTPFEAATQLRSANLSGLDDIVGCYDCVGLYGRIPDLNTLETLINPTSTTVATLIEVPACFELGIDLHSVSASVHISLDALIATFLNPIYTCFAVGFTPGFPYLGTLADAIAGIPRLPQPRAKTDPGSIGITGRQTGIYPAITPGGWPIIARCPRVLVDLADDYFAFEAGVQVRFQRIDSIEFGRQSGWRLT